MPKNINTTIKGVNKMTNKNKKYDEKIFFMNTKRLSEKYIMLSTCLSRHNIEEILFRSISHNNNLLKNSMTFLNDWLKKINAYKTANVEEYRQLLTEYNDNFFNYPTKYINDFISFSSSGLIREIVELSYIASGNNRKSVPLNNADEGNRNLIYTFNSEIFFEHVHDENEVPFYANAFWNFLMLILLTEYINKFMPDNEVISLNLDAFHNFISLNILTGLRMSVEFETDVLYEELFEEISQFIPSNKHNMVITLNEDKQTISFRVKNNIILAKAFKNEGYRKVKHVFEPILDRKSEGELRIKCGSKQNSIAISLYVTGMRTISRILSLNCDPLSKVYLRDFFERGGIFISLITSFYYRTIIQNCIIKINKSHCSIYSDFIKNYIGERNTALKSAVIILLSELPKNKQKKLLDRYFNRNDYRIKQDINKDLMKLNIQIQKDKSCATIRFYNTLRRHYGW